jgi:ankyrin repeat protein
MDTLRTGNVELARYLIQNGADVNMNTLQNHEVLAALGYEGIHDNNGLCALCCAVISDNFEMVKLLVDTGKADLENPSAGGLTALHIAIMGDKVKISKYLIQQGAKIDNNENFKSSMPVHLAAGRPTCTLLRYLIEVAGADPHATGDLGSPLIVAVVCGAFDNVEYLVSKHKADANSTGINGAKPVILAAEAGDLRILSYLIKKGGADINVVDRDGNTALMRAAIMNDAEVIECLIEHGAEVSKKRIDGKDALTLAADSGSSVAFGCLVSFGDAGRPYTQEELTLLEKRVAELSNRYYPRRYAGIFDSESDDSFGGDDDDDEPHFLHAHLRDIPFSEMWDFAVDSMPDYYRDFCPECNLEHSLYDSEDDSEDDYDDDSEDGFE